MKFQKNQQDADFSVKAVGCRFERGRNLRRANPIFPKGSPRRRMIFEVCLQSDALIKDRGYVRIQLWAEETNPKAGDFYRKENYGEQKIHFFCKYL